MKLSKLVPVDPVEWVVIALVVTMAGILYVGLMGWPSWVPWSAEQRLPKVEAQLDHTEDVLQSANAQAGVVVSAQNRNQAARDLSAIIEAMTYEDLHREAAAPSPGLELGRLCDYPIYASDPACAAPQGGSQPGSAPAL